MKKIISLLLVSVMLLALFAGCGTKAILSSTEELPEGEYLVMDGDDVVATIVSTGKKITVLNEDEEELLEETKFKYSDKDEAFTVDGEKAFSLSIEKKTVTITVPKNSPLGIKKGDYTLTTAEAKGGKDSKKDDKSGDAPTLEKGWYAVLEDDEAVGYLYCAGKKLAAYDEDGSELMAEAKFSYDEDEGAFMIDDTAAFSLTVEKKTTTITVPKKSPLGIKKGDYTLEACEEDDVPTATASGTKPSSTDTPAATASGSTGELYAIITDGSRTLSMQLTADLAKEYTGVISDDYGTLSHFSDDYTTYVSFTPMMYSSFGISADALKGTAEDAAYFSDTDTVLTDSGVLVKNINGITWYVRYYVVENSGNATASYIMYADDGSNYMCISLMEAFMTNSDSGNKESAMAAIETFAALANSVVVK